MQRIIQHLQRIVGRAERSAQSDRDLLERFLSAGDDGAFAALVHRHGPMVLAVCRRITGDVHEAEDAFQATFLVLVRKAASLARRDLLAGWLHGVACRTAWEMRKRRIRRQSRERQVDQMPQPQVEVNQELGELAEIIDRELQRLPEKYRLPIVLCDLQSQSRTEAARLLGIPEGTLSSRLNTARKKLEHRLLRTGVVATAPELAALFAAGPSKASVPPALVQTTVESALSLFNLGGSAISPAVLTLTNRVLSILGWEKMKKLTIYLVALVALGTLLGAAFMATGQGGGQAKKDERAKVAPVEEKQQQAQRPKEELRYDGKSFSDWKRVLDIELKAERLIEAIHAMQAFGINGYGEKAAKALLEFTEHYQPARDNEFPSFPYRGGKDPGTVLNHVYSALSTIGQPAVPLLQRKLASGGTNTRRIAVDALYLIEPRTQPMQEALIKATRDDDAGVRYRAIHAVARTRSEFIKDSIVPLSLAVSDTERRIRLAAMRQLRSLSPEVQQPEKLVNIVLIALADPAVDVRREAVEWVAQNRHRLKPAELQRLVGRMAEMLDDKDHAAVYVHQLFRQGQSATQATELQKALITTFDSTKDWQIRAEIYRTIGELGVLAPDERTKMLEVLASPDNPDEESRTQAQRDLKRLRSSKK